MKLRTWLSTLLATLLIAAGVVVVPAMVPEHAHADYATGDGELVDSIYWLDWSTASPTYGSGINNGRRYHEVRDGTTVTQQPVPGVTIEATFRNVSATPWQTTGQRQLHVAPQDPNWSEIRLNGYDTGGQYSVITPNTNNSHITFGLDFEARLDSTGELIPFNVIVTDGESAGASEPFIFTTNGEDWQNIDNTTREDANMWRSGQDPWTPGRGTPENGGFGTQIVGPWITEEGTGQGMAPIAVTRNATSIDVNLRATGMQNVMVGFMFPTDFGDAPESYGTAAHIIEWDAVGDPMALPGTANAPGVAFDWSQNPYLGSVPADADGQPFGSGGSEWVGDDTTGEADEGWEQLTGVADPPVLYEGMTQDYSLEVLVGNSNNTPVSAWIDWNNDGQFQSNERAQATASNGSATLSWSDVEVPTGIEGIGARFRTASVVAQVEEPTGMASDGEVEDHLIPVTQRPTAAVVKSSDPESGSEVGEGDTVVYTLTFTNPDDNAPQAVVDHVDHLTEVIDDAVLDEESITVDGDGLTANYADEAIRVEGTLSSGETSTVSYAVTVSPYDTGNNQLSNVVVPSGSDAVCNDEGTNCTEHRVVENPPVLAMEKSSDPVTGSAVLPGDTIDYTVTVENSGGPAANVVLTDDLTDVLDDAEFVTGSAQLVIGDEPPIEVADPVRDEVNDTYTLSTQPFTLPAHANVSLNYQVILHDDAWSSTIGNTVTGSWGEPEDPETPGDVITCDTGENAEDLCATEHHTNAKVLIEKIGEDATGSWVPMDGSDWSILLDQNGVPGDAVADLKPAAVEGQIGRFEAENLPAGTYWLQENQAPEGFNLLAQPVAFTIDEDGTVTLGDGSENGVVSLDADEDTGLGLLTVRDVPTLEIPETGGFGTGLFMAIGGGLVVIALGLSMLWSRSNRTTALN